MRKKDEKLAIDRANYKMQEKKENDIASRMKRYADALRGQSQSKRIEVVGSFCNVERLFKDFDVPVDLQAALHRPFLTD